MYVLCHTTAFSYSESSYSYVTSQVVSITPTGVTSSEDGSLVFSAVGLPSGLTVNTATGVVSGTVAAVASGSSYPSDGTAGSYSVTITFGAGSTGAVTTASFTISVTDKFIASKKKCKNL